MADDPPAASPPALAAPLERWIDAIHHPGDPARLEAAVTDDVRVERHAPAPRASEAPGALAQVLEGRAAVAAWLAQSPAPLTFGLDGAVAVVEGGPHAGALAARYWYEVPELRNGGRWWAWLQGERISRLVHAPFALEDAPAPPGATPPAHEH